jgi:2-amino-4-hydroxy-6-hydroxymethyldihydropteridine diphosphokinase
MPSVFLSLGSNIDPERNLKAAASLLRAEFPSIRFSTVVRTKAREVEAQADFLNTAATFETDRKPENVLRALQHIEIQLGKSPPFRFGPRTIDLDLLLYDNLICSTAHEEKTMKQEPRTKQLNTTATRNEIILPHPRMHERRFVLEPLSELIDRKGRHPVTGETWNELLQKTLDQECVKTMIIL